MTDHMGTVLGTKLALIGVVIGFLIARNPPYLLDPEALDRSTEPKVRGSNPFGRVEKILAFGAVAQSPRERALLCPGRG